MSKQDGAMSLTTEEKKDYRRMLRDIEDAGGLEYMSFVEICDGDEDFYGKPNSERRSWFQKKVNLLKRMKPDGYLKRLEAFKVKPSEQTKQLNEDAAELSPPSFTDINDLKDSKKAAASTMDDDGLDDFIADDDKDDEEDEEDEEDDEEENAGHDLAAMLAGLGLGGGSAGGSSAGGLVSGVTSVASSVAESSRPGSHSSSVTPPRGGRKTPPRTPPRVNLLKDLKMRAIRGAYGSIGMPTSVFFGNGTLDTFVGSKQAPQRIDVNIHFPERNYPFLIEIVPEVLEDHLPITLFDISTVIDYPDINNWLFSIPKGAPYNRALCRFPSLNYWHTEMEIYHRKLKCATTKTKHKTTATAVKEDQERKHFYIMLNFPFMIENMVISKSRSKVKSNLNIMKNKPSHIGVDLAGSALAWRIAVREEADRSTEGAQEYDLRSEYNK